jgi:hypothetical protein
MLKDVTVEYEPPHLLFGIVAHDEKDAFASWDRNGVVPDRLRLQGVGAGLRAFFVKLVVGMGTIGLPLASVRALWQFHSMFVKVFGRRQAELHLVNVEIVQGRRVVYKHPKLLVAMASGIETNTNVLMMLPFPIHAALGKFVGFKGHWGLL